MGWLVWAAQHMTVDQIECSIQQTVERPRFARNLSDTFCNFGLMIEGIHG